MGRFRNQWEAEASLALRSRQPSIAATYERQGRITEATTDNAFDRAAVAWWADTEAGHRTLVVVDTASHAAEVSTRCQHHLTVAARLGDHVADTADGCRIHIGDQIQTRRNTSDILATDRHRILNRDVWTVLERHDDGSLLVEHASRSARALAHLRHEVIEILARHQTHEARRNALHAASRRIDWRLPTAAAEFLAGLRLAQPKRSTDWAGAEPHAMTRGFER